MSDDKFDQVLDAPQDVQVKSGEADVARDCQAKPDSLTDAQQKQDEKRKNYETNSSSCLPRVLVLDGEAGAKVVQIAQKVIDYVVGDEQTATKVKHADVPLGEVQPVSADDVRRIKPEDVKPGDPQSANQPFGIAFGDMKSLRAADVVNANDSLSAKKALAGGDAPVRTGTTVVEHAKGTPGPDLQKDAADIRKATERDDLIDTGTDEKAIFKAMEGKTPEQTLEIMKIYAKDNKGADLMQDLKEELTEEEYAKVKDQLQDAKALEKLQGDQQVGKAHEALEKRARETMQEPELSKFLKDMNKFEGREASLQREFERELLAKGKSPEEAAKEAEKKSKEQIEKTYQNMERLLEKNDKAPVDEKDRILLAQQAMRHAADPKTISQGEYGTCGAESVQTRTYTKDPVEATRLVADVATTGEYTGNGKPPVTVKLDAESLKKQGQSNHVPPLDNERDYSSQLFDVTTYNIILEQKNRLTTPPGDLHYEQHPGVAGAKPADNGSRLVDYSQADPETGAYPRVVDKNPGLYPQELAGAAKEISPSTSDDAVVIEHSSDAGARAKDRTDDLRLEAAKNGIDLTKIDANDPEFMRKAHEAIDNKEGLDPNKAAELHRRVNEIEKDKACIQDKSVIGVKSEQEMKDTLARLKEEGKLPVVIFVDMNNQPFWDDSGGGAAGGSGGRHFVTITDYDKETGIAKMQNQWGASSSHDISAKDIFEATRAPADRIPTLQAEVDANRKGWWNDVDYGKENELLRLKKLTGKISEDDYNKKKTELALEQYEELKSKGAEKSDDYAKRYEFLQLGKQAGKISDEDYDKKIVEMTVERYKKWQKEGADPKDPQYNKASKVVMQMLADIEKTDPERAKKIREEVKKGTA